MPDPSPVRARASQARAYNRRLRDEYLDRVFDVISAPVLAARSFGDALQALSGAMAEMPAPPEGVIGTQAADIAAYQRAAIISSFRRAFAVDISDVLDDAAEFLAQWRADNVALIRTIPTRLHDDLVREMGGLPAFDQRELSQLLRSRYRVAGWNLRRIVIDQTNKGILGLTMHRHEELGIREYIWRTAGDERVRPLHSQLGGSIQRWDTPTSEGYPGSAVMCRCVAQPHVSGEALASLAPLPRP